MDGIDGEVAQLYAGALQAIARVDHEITPEEGARLRALVEARTAAEIDYEESWFTKVTPERLAAAVPAAAARAIGLALVSDAVALATADGDLRGVEAQAILRYARALGCSAADVAAATRLLDEWLAQLG